MAWEVPGYGASSSIPEFAKSWPCQMSGHGGWSAGLEEGSMTGGANGGDALVHPSCYKTQLGCKKKAYTSLGWDETTILVWT